MMDLMRLFVLCVFFMNGCASTFDTKATTAESRTESYDLKFNSITTKTGEFIFLRKVGDRHIIDSIYPFSNFAYEKSGKVILDFKNIKKYHPINEADWEVIYLDDSASRPYVSTVYEITSFVGVTKAGCLGKYPNYGNGRPLKKAEVERASSLYNPCDSALSATTVAMAPLDGIFTGIAGVAALARGRKPRALWTPKLNSDYIRDILDDPTFRQSMSYLRKERERIETLAGEFFSEIVIWRKSVRAEPVIENRSGFFISADEAEKLLSISLLPRPDAVEEETREIQLRSLRAARQTGGAADGVLIVRCRFDGRKNWHGFAGCDDMQTVKFLKGQPVVSVPLVLTGRTLDWNGPKTISRSDGNLLVNFERGTLTARNLSKEFVTVENSSIYFGDQIRTVTHSSPKITLPPGSEMIIDIRKHLDGLNGIDSRGRTTLNNVTRQEARQAIYNYGFALQYQIGDSTKTISDQRAFSALELAEQL